MDLFAFYEANEKWLNLLASMAVGTAAFVKSSPISQRVLLFLLGGCGLLSWLWSCVKPAPKPPLPPLSDEAALIISNCKQAHLKGSSDDILEFGSAEFYEGGKVSVKAVDGGSDRSLVPLDDRESRELEVAYTARRAMLLQDKRARLRMCAAVPK